MPSVKLALDHVNEHSDILSNYRLHMWWNDTQVNILELLFLKFILFHLTFSLIVCCCRNCSVMQLLVSSHFLT